jgi:hypothetical protein
MRHVHLKPFQTAERILITAVLGINGQAERKLKSGSVEEAVAVLKKVYVGRLDSARGGYSLVIQRIREFKARKDDRGKYLKYSYPSPEGVRTVTAHQTEKVLSSCEADKLGHGFANTGFIKVISRALGEYAGTPFTDDSVKDYVFGIVRAISLFKSAYIIAKGYRDGKYGRRYMPIACKGYEVKPVNELKVLLYTDEWQDTGDMEAKRVKSNPFDNGFFSDQGTVVAAVPLFDRVYSEYGFICLTEHYDPYLLVSDTHLLPTFVVVYNDEERRFKSYLTTGRGYTEVGTAVSLPAALRRISNVYAKAIFSPQTGLEEAVKEMMQEKYMKLVPRIPSGEEVAEAVMASAREDLISEIIHFDKGISKFSPDFTIPDFFLFRTEEVARQTGLDLSGLKQDLCEHDADASFAFDRATTKGRKTIRETFCRKH